MTKVVSRYNVDSEGELSESRAGARIARFIPPHLVKRLSQEGYVLLRTTKGATHEDIVTGEAIPDRSMPKSKVAKAPRAARTPEEKAERKKAVQVAKLKAKLAALTAAA